MTDPHQEGTPAGTSPADRARSAVLVAGLGADATYRAVDVLLRKGLPAAEVLVAPAGGGVRAVVATPAERHQAEAAGAGR